MVERSHGAVTKVLNFHDRTSSDMFSLMVYLWVSSISPSLHYTVDPNITF